MKNCKGCSGILGKDCFNEDECIQIGNTQNPHYMEKEQLIKDIIFAISTGDKIIKEMQHLCPDCIEKNGWEPKEEYIYEDCDLCGREDAVAYVEIKESISPIEKILEVARQYGINLN